MAQAAVEKHLARAGQFLQARRPREALPHLRAAAHLQPGNAIILHDLGLACLECGERDEAIAALQGAIAANPRYADAHLRLGIAFENAGAHAAALAAYGEAAKIKPALADAHYRAGDLLDNLGRIAEAAQRFRRAAAAAPKTTLGRIAAARAQRAANQDSAAEKILRHALALEKDSVIALELLGDLLADAGRFAEAEPIFLRAIEKAPLRAGSFYDIARCRRIGPNDAGLMASMRAALEQTGLQPVPRARVHLALGKAAADLGHFAEAMQHFDAAEAIRNTLVRFDLAHFEARVDRLIAHFTADFCAHPEPAANNGALPILIIGLPRSGTTLVEQILSAHPQIAGAGEVPFWNEHGMAWENAGAPAFDADFLGHQAASYLHLLRSVAPKAARVTDKLPLNFLWAGLIHKALPTATIIHCRRSSIDTALSIHQTHFNPRMHFPTGGSDLVGYIRAKNRLCAHWQKVLPPDRFIEVDYEALTENPEPEIRRLLAASGLDWNAACLHPELNRRIVKTASKFQARQPIHRNSNARWRSYEPWLGPLRALLHAGP